MNIFKRKNPNLKGEEFIDSTFIDMLYRAIIFNHPKDFADALVYKNIGIEKCGDCSDHNQNIFYNECKCENYLEDYDIDKRDKYPTSFKLINAVEKQFRYIPSHLLIKFRSKLINIDYSDKKVKIPSRDVKDIINEINYVISKRK